MPPPRLKPPTKTRAEIVLELKERVRHMSKADMFNVLIEHYTALDLEAILRGLPAPSPAHRTPVAGDYTSVDVGTAGGTSARPATRSHAPADGTWDGDPVSNPDPSGFATG